jgi:hypothetical protein
LATAITLASPVLSTTAVLLGGKVALLPLVGAIKLTTPPWTGSPNELLTDTTSGMAKDVFTRVC